MNKFFSIIDQNLAFYLEEDKKFMMAILKKDELIENLLREFIEHQINSKPLKLIVKEDAFN